jgi:hypothetical protein
MRRHWDKAADGGEATGSIPGEPPPRLRGQAHRGYRRKPVRSRHERVRIGAREPRDRRARVPGQRDQRGRRAVRTPDVVTLDARPHSPRQGAAVAMPAVKADGAACARRRSGGQAPAALVQRARDPSDPRHTRGGGPLPGVTAPPRRRAPWVLKEPIERLPRTNFSARSGLGRPTESPVQIASARHHP